MDGRDIAIINETRAIQKARELELKGFLKLEADLIALKKKRETAEVFCEYGYTPYFREVFLRFLSWKHWDISQKRSMLEKHIESVRVMVFDPKNVPGNSYSLNRGLHNMAKGIQRMNHMRALTNDANNYPDETTYDYKGDDEYDAKPWMGIVRFHVLLRRISSARTIESVKGQLEDIHVVRHFHLEKKYLPQPKKVRAWVYTGKIVTLHHIDCMERGCLKFGYAICSIRDWRRAYSLADGKWKVIGKDKPFWYAHPDKLIGVFNIHLNSQVEEEGDEVEDLGNASPSSVDRSRLPLELPQLPNVRILPAAPNDEIVQVCDYLNCMNDVFSTTPEYTCDECRLVLFCSEACQHRAIHGNGIHLNACRPTREDEGARPMISPFAIKEYYRSSALRMMDRAMLRYIGDDSPALKPYRFKQYIL